MEAKRQYPQGCAQKPRPAVALMVTLPLRHTDVQSETVIGSSFIGSLCLFHVRSLILIIQMDPWSRLIGSGRRTGRTGVFIMAKSLVPVRDKVDLFPSALCVRLTWIGLWCRGQVGSELEGSRRRIKDEPPRQREHSRTFPLYPQSGSFCSQRHESLRKLLLIIN